MKKKTEGRTFGIAKDTGKKREKIPGTLP